ncbi:MAG: phospholipase D-like domain-containing protein, partial [Thermoanaerobaculia bacterium]|nr:phospholipase D-like domain-containing protein [Thermoanaerobaculia bacterium]
MWLNLTLFLLLMFLLLFLLVFALTYLGRGTEIERIRYIGEEQRDFSVGSDDFRENFKLLVDTVLWEHNEVELCLNGDGTYERLFEDLRRAEKLITWHVYFFKPGELADRLAEVLIERAQAGVRVLFLFDFFGSLGVSKEYRRRLEDAGVETATFRPLKWNTFFKLQQRMHARSVVIDGKIGWTGGFAIADQWLGGGRADGEWRDTNVRIRGPAVDQLQASFVANWAEASGELLMGDDIFRLDSETRYGEMVAGVMYATPSFGSTVSERFFMASITGARETLYITNPYFVPAWSMSHALGEAVDRGVDVRVLTPGRNSDSKLAFWASRSQYRRLLERGVRIYEYDPAMVHAKTLVVDRIWSSVGTVNFDNRSIMLNDEVAVVVENRTLGEELHEI